MPNSTFLPTMMVTANSFVGCPSSWWAPWERNEVGLENGVTLVAIKEPDFFPPDMSRGNIRHNCTVCSEEIESLSGSGTKRYRGTRKHDGVSGNEN